MGDHIEVVKETPTKDVLYDTLDKLILQAEEQPGPTQRNTADPSSDVLSSGLTAKVDEWPEQSVQEMATLCDEVLADMDAQYALIEQKVQEQQRRSRRRKYGTEDLMSDLEKESQDLVQKEQMLRSTLESLNSDVAKKEKELTEIEQQLQKQKAVEEEFTNTYFDLKLDYIEYKKQRESIDFRNRYIRALNQKLQRANVFSLVFQITENERSGQAAINGFKLSGSADDEMEWSEANCAWGQLSLLLNGLLHKLTLSKTEMKVVPMGPWSYVEKSESGNPERLPLYHSSSIKAFFRGEKKYIEACIAMIECFEYVCNEGLKLYHNGRAPATNQLFAPETTTSRVSGRHMLPVKWGTLKKYFTDKKYQEAGRGLLKNISKILLHEKLAN